MCGRIASDTARLIDDIAVARIQNQKLGDLGTFDKFRWRFV
jgi:hypothetical protein